MDALIDKNVLPNFSGSTTIMLMLLKYVNNFVDNSACREPIEWPAMIYIVEVSSTIIDLRKF